MTQPASGLLSTAVELRCIECNSFASSSALGWRAYVVEDPEGDDDPEVAIYCPTCAQEQFGSPGEQARQRKQQR